MRKLLLSLLVVFALGAATWVYTAQIRTSVPADNFSMTVESTPTAVKMGIRSLPNPNAPVG